MFELTQEQAELLWTALDDIAANAYDLFDEEAMNYAQETLDKFDKLRRNKQ